MTSLNASTSAVNAIQQVNNLTIVGGVPLFGVSILFFCWIIIYMRSRNTGPKEAIAVASFFTSIVGIALQFLGLLTEQILGIVIALAILSMIPLFNRR